MSYTLLNSSASAILRTFATNPPNPELTIGHDILEAIQVNGLGVRIGSAGIAGQTDVDDAFATLGGAETANNLSTLTHWFNYLNVSADQLTRMLFKENLTPFVQHDNRSVIAAFGRSSVSESVQNMLAFIMSYVGKDIKHPIRTLLWEQTGQVNSSTYNHTMQSNLTYSEEEVGTYPSLLPVESQASRVTTYNTYLEDTPLVRRYLRYLDSIATRYGIRVVYCPKSFDNLDDLSSLARPTWRITEEDQVVRQHRGTRHRALFVSMAFSYETFAPLTVVETEVQPGQTPLSVGSIIYTPVVAEYAGAFVHVLKQLGAFSVCKIYYKGSRTPARS